MISLDERLTPLLQEALERVEHDQAVPACGPAGSTPREPRMGLEAARWEISKDPSFGDLSSSVAFKLAAPRRAPPQQIAEALATTLLAVCRARYLEPMIERIEAKVGFLNIFLSHAALIAVLRRALRQGHRYGRNRAQHACPINVEFVSANPTGPLSVAHGRQAVVGDVLARLLRSQGYRVTTEYYLNDEGRQVDLLGESLRARYREQLGEPVTFPEDGYQGDYLIDQARRLVAEQQDRLHDAPVATFAAIGMAHMVQEIRTDLERFGVVFDRWSSQRWLRTSGQIDAVLKTLQARGALYEADGATWFASTRFGDDKDRVVKKRTGELTYLTPDIAYHAWKFRRGYTQLLNLWGPDHHGYIPRVKAAMTALGLPADRLLIRIVQLVTLLRQGKAVPMSKRQGEFVTLREIMDEIGTDAVRFFFLMRTMESHLDVDLELAKSQSQENPVYYVQYAHARISSILARARVPGWRRVRPALHLLTAPEERVLLRACFYYPLVLKQCAATREPQGLTTFLRTVAEQFHVFYTKHRVLDVEPPRSAARLALVQATQVVLANGLGLLGVSAPRKM